MIMNFQNGFPDFDISDFNRRWRAARLSAIDRACKNTNLDLSLNLNLNTIIELDSNQEAESNKESSLLEQFFFQAPSKGEGDALLRAVFENSRLLAMSLSKSLGVSFEIDDFRALLEQSTIPCFQGQWESRKTAQVLNRQGCNFSPKSGPAVCDYWREALDGLIMGLGENERLARHSCVRHFADSGETSIGGSNALNTNSCCVDVIFVENTGHPFKADSLAWGPLPEHMTETLAQICSDFSEKMKTAILIKGLNEGVLYFEFESQTAAGCSGGNLLSSTFQRKVHAVYPGLHIQEVSPRAVLGAEA